MKFNMCASGVRSIDGSREANTQKVTVDYFPLIIKDMKLLKLIQYILAIIVTASSAYCGLYLCVLGLCLEDGVMMLTSTLFIGIAYFFPKIAKISESVYTKKITDKVYNFFYSEEI